MHVANKAVHWKMRELTCRKWAIKPIFNLFNLFLSLHIGMEKRVPPIFAQISIGFSELLDLS